MSRNGEQGPRLGSGFRKNSISLLKQLGYREIFNRRFGIDYVSKPPSDGKFIRPKYSPNNVTAFEFTSEIGVRIAAEAETLLAKINEYNESHQEQREISGGIVIIDTKARKAHLEALEQIPIFCWDIRHLCFLAAKVRLWFDWVPPERRMGSITAHNEQTLNESVTYFKVYNKLPRFIETNLAIFHHNPTEIIDTSDIPELVDIPLSRIKDIANDQAIYTVLNAELHIAGELNVEQLDDYIEILVEYEDNFIKIQKDRCKISNYNIAPWASFLPPM